MRETPKALAAFQAYVDLGPQRSLRKLGEVLRVELATLGRWSSSHKWTDRILKMMHEEQDAARDAAKREAARLAKQRLRKAQAMSDSGILIISKADLSNLGVEEARQLVASAQRLIESGIKAERLELGETTEILSPPKPFHEMSDSELDAYIAMMERS